MQTWVSGDHDCSLDMLLLWGEGNVVGDRTVELALLQDVPLVYYLSNKGNTPMILADFSIRMLLFTFN